MQPRVMCVTVFTHTSLNWHKAEPQSDHDSSQEKLESNLMKKIILLSVVVVTSGLCLAQEVGRVISSTPIIQQFSVPRQVCTTEQVAVQQPKSGAGALMGAIAGGAMGNAVGGGAGKAAATMIGIFGGAIVGDRVEGAPMAQLQNVQRCSTQTFYENRPVAYNVVYEYAGKQYSLQMPHDPGPSIQLQVTPVGASAAQTVPNNSATYTQPSYEQAPNMVVAQPVYRGRYVRPYYQPVEIEMNYGYGDESRGRRNWH